MAVDLRLIRATPDNGVFSRLERSWKHQITSAGASSGWFGPYIDHAREIAAETPQDPRYGIYVLCATSSQNTPKAPYEGLIHVNHAHPKSRKPDLRLIWYLIAPKYDLTVTQPDQVARIIAGFINGALRLSMTELPSSTVKMYLGNAIDRQFAIMFASVINTVRIDTIGAGVRGQWLHLDWKQPSTRKRGK